MMRILLLSLGSLILHVSIYIALTSFDLPLPIKKPQVFELIPAPQAPAPPKEKIVIESHSEQKQTALPKSIPQLLPAQISSTKIEPVTNRDSEEPLLARQELNDLKSHLASRRLAEILYRKIDAGLEFPREILRDKNEMHGTIPFEVDSSGRLIRIYKDLVEGDSMATGVGYRLSRKGTEISLSYGSGRRCLF
jgi:hypothetical protein